MKLMILRKELVRKGGEENEAKADKILQEVERTGGLTKDEILALSMY
jgi:hypothetical protein